MDKSHHAPAYAISVTVTMADAHIENFYFSFSNGRECAKVHGNSISSNVMNSHVA
jgi:hypothetical protein